MTKIIISSLLAINILSSFPVNSAELENRSSRETQMAESAIVTSLIIQSNPQSQHLCSENAYACLGVNQGELGLVILGNQIQSDALIRLLRFRLDASLAEDFQCYILSNGKRNYSFLKNINSVKLRNACLSEVDKVIRGNPEKFSDEISDKVCTAEASIKAKRDELLNNIERGKKCNASDF